MKPGIVEWTTLLPKYRMVKEISSN